VKIGSEQQEENLKGTSVVSIGYGEVGALGIIGPTRMDYASSMAAVSAVANYVSRYLQENA
jgi:heat-inducible transcriptional repressor